MCLRTFRVVGAKIDVYESPMMLVGNLRAQTVYLVVASGDAHQLGAENLRAKNFRGLEIRRDKDPGFESVARGMRGNGIRQISRRRAGNNLKSKRLCLRQRDRYHAVLKAKRRQANGVVL